MFARKKKKVSSIIETSKATRESDPCGPAHNRRPVRIVPVEIHQRYAVDKTASQSGSWALVNFLER